MFFANNFANIWRKWSNSKSIINIPVRPCLQGAGLTTQQLEGILDAIFKDAPYFEELDLDEYDVSLVAHKLAKVTQLKTQTQTQNRTKI